MGKLVDIRRELQQSAVETLAYIGSKRRAFETAVDEFTARSEAVDARFVSSETHRALSDEYGALAEYSRQIAWDLDNEVRSYWGLVHAAATVADDFCNVCGGELGLHIILCEEVAS